MAGKLPRFLATPAVFLVLRLPRFFLSEDGGNAAGSFLLPRGGGIPALFDGVIFGSVFDLEFVSIDGGGKGREIGRLVAHLVEVAVAQQLRKRREKAALPARRVGWREEC